MFRSAQLRLTAFYLIVIMLISLFFSFLVYNSVNSEMAGRFQLIELRLRIEGRLPMHRSPQAQEPFLEDHLTAAKRRVLLTLLYTNGLIFLISGVAGYFLAGKTLKPIKKTLEEQKRFVADASHELRTPLAALKTSTEVTLRDKKLSTKDAKEALESNLEDVNNLEVLTEDLLSLSQYEKGPAEFVFGAVNVAEIVDSAYRKIQSLAKSKNIKVKTDVEEIKMDANKTNLEKLVLILLDNAVKYTNKGGSVNIKGRHDKGHLLLEVKDSGIGIEDRDVNNIFQRFYRVDQSRSKNNVPGFGLGLSMAKEIIDLHKGSIKVSSTLNKGTTFTVRLPLKH